MPQYDGIDGFDGSCNGIKKEDERIGSRLIDGFNIILKKNHLIIRNNLTYLKSIGEVKQLK